MKRSGEFMKLHVKTAKMQPLENKINAHLAALPAEKRPELPNRSRVQSVAYSGAGAFEAADREGHAFLVPVKIALSWLNL